MNTIAKDNFPHIFDYLNQIDLLRLLSVNKLLNEMVMKYINNTKFYKIKKNSKFRKACINNHIISFIKMNNKQNFDWGINIASKYGNIELIKKMINRNEIEVDINAITDSLFNSCIYGYIELVKIFIEYITITDTSCDELEKIIIDNKNDALDYATLYGHFDIVKYLLENGANEPSLINACIGGNLDIVKLFITIGCDNYEESFLFACRNNKYEIINYYIENKYISDDNILLWDNVSLSAIKNNNIKLLKISLKRKIDDINSITKYYLKINNIEDCCNINMFDLLFRFENNNININEYFIYACSYGKIDLVEYMIKYNINEDILKEGMKKACYYRYRCKYVCDKNYRLTSNRITFYIQIVKILIKLLKLNKCEFCNETYDEHIEDPDCHYIDKSNTIFYMDNIDSNM